jgi:phosphohistidine phosphatase
MRIILFRHGIAGDPDPSRWPDDGDRPLTPRGMQKTRAAARGLARLERGIGAILTSPYRRARQTADLLQESIGKRPGPVELEALAPQGSYRAVLEAVNERVPAGTVVLVGHEPDLGKLAGVLVFGQPSALPLKKAGAAAVDFTGPVRPGGGTLRWLLPPKHLRGLGRRAAKAGRT